MLFYPVTHSIPSEERDLWSPRELFGDDLANGLVGYWPLNGHAKDVSGHGNHLTTASAAYPSSSRGRVLEADGSNTTASADLGSLTAPLTLSIWSYTHDKTYRGCPGVDDNSGSWGFNDHYAGWEILTDDLQWCCRGGPETPTDIYVMNVDGSSRTKLTNKLTHDAFSSLSSDGTKIAFHSNRDGNYDIYVMNADGSNQTRLTDNPARDAQPSWR